MSLIGEEIEKLRFSAQYLLFEEAKYKVLFESAQDAIFVMEKNVFIDCNDAAVLMFGCDNKEDLIGKTPDTFSPLSQPNGTLSSQSAYVKISAALSGYPQRFVWTHTRKDGELFTAEVNLNRIDIKGKPYHMAVLRRPPGDEAKADRL